jgi:hypothetical protein
MRPSPLLVCLVFSGCAAPPAPLGPPTPSEREALEARTFDAPGDRLARAAADALLDAGSILRGSDSEAGLLCGERRASFATAAQYARAGGLGGAPGASDLAVVWVRADGGRAAARLHLEVAGHARADPAAYADFGRRVDARLLPREPAP